MGFKKKKSDAPGWGKMGVGKTPTPSILEFSGDNGSMYGSFWELAIDYAEAAQIKTAANALRIRGRKLEEDTVPYYS